MDSRLDIENIWLSRLVEPLIVRLHHTHLLASATAACRMDSGTRTTLVRRVPLFAFTAVVIMVKWQRRFAIEPNQISTFNPPN